MGMARALWLVVALLCAVSASTHARLAPSEGPTPGTTEFGGRDPCTYALEQPTPSAVLACFESFPFNMTVASATIDTLLKTIPHYVFTDIARDSPEPLLPSKVLLKEGLEAIYASALAGAYSTEYEFEQDIYTLFWSLNDGHTYYQSDCFTSWYYSHGVVLMAVVDDGQLQLKVVPEEYHLPDIPFFKKYAGWEVVQINGVPAVDYIKDFAETQVGAAKDVNSRFNAALFNLYVNTSGTFDVSYGSFAQQFAPSVKTIPPREDSLTFLFRNGTVTALETAAYYAFFIGTPFSSREEYFQLHCEAPSDEFEGLGLGTQRRSLAEEPDLRVFVQEVVSTLSLVNESVGVITIPATMNSVTVTPDAFRASFMFSLISGVEQLKAAGVKKLILDLTQNTGGRLDLLGWLPNILFPEAGDKSLSHRFSASSPLAALAVETANLTDNKASWYHWSNWAKESGTARFKSLDDGFFFPLENITYGGVQREWGRKFKYLRAKDLVGVPLDDKFGLQSVIPSALVKPFKRAPFAAKDILILTNGICYSACALISTTLSQFHGVRTVTVGGIPGHPQQIGNTPGSLRLPFLAFRIQLAFLELQDHPLAPQPFLRKVTFGFTIHAAYGPISKDTPLEFVFKPSTFNLDYTTATATSLPALWQEVAKLF